MEEMTALEAAEKWGISSRRIAILCQEGRIPGAHKQGKRWILPASAQKPADNRSQKAGKPADTGLGRQKSLPIGISDFRKAVTEYYYVDKTLLIRDFLDERPQVSLFTRPRRFGKSLTMDMLRVFFEKTDEDTSVYFRDKLIWTCGEDYQAYQGKYPVISLTFKDVKCENWEKSYDLIQDILQNEMNRHRVLLGSPALSDYDKQYIERILSGSGNESDYLLFLLNLSRMLHTHYGIAPIILIDEYDTPIQQGHLRGYYAQVIDFIRGLFSGGLKDNPHLSYGFLTGILRVAKESIFSGLNNLIVNSILDEPYSEYFGFTLEEVRQMAAYYHASEKISELTNWYDGYRFGNTDIFNPWSVLRYFHNRCVPQAFWELTGGNDIISEVLQCASEETLEQLESLLQGGSVLTHIDTSVIYPQIQTDPSSIYSFLLMTGYLKVVSKVQPFGEDYLCEVKLPNREIASVYFKEVLARYSQLWTPSDIKTIQMAVYTGDIAKLQKGLQQFLLQSVSFYDTSSEAFYHGLVLGLCAMLDNRYRIFSNREAGVGRFDIMLLPIKPKLPGILMELKAKKDCTEEQLETLARAALNQIQTNSYVAELTAHGVQIILRYGIAFSGKQVKVCVDKITHRDGIILIE